MESIKRALELKSGMKVKRNGEWCKVWWYDRSRQEITIKEPDGQVRILYLNPHDPVTVEGE